MVKRSVKLLISYDGSQFLGWQETPFGITIEETLRKALEHILCHKIVLQAASRTDRGVHAVNQVVQFFTEKECDHYLLQALNALLPKSIRVHHLENVPLHFHPTLDAIGKEYHYHIYRGDIQPPTLRHTSWHIYQPLNVEEMKKGAAFFLGKHDFSSLCNVRKQGEVLDKVTEVYSISFQMPTTSELVITVYGKKFLYKMVRNIVGTLVDVGRGKMSLNDIISLFEKKDRRKAGITAPAHALFLNKVVYTV